MKSLTYLFADRNNLGINEGDEKDSINDSLSVLPNLKKLYAVYLRNNAYLKYVDYLKDVLNTDNQFSIKALYLIGCDGMKDTSVANIKDLINSCTSKDYPSKYWLSLLANDSTTVSLANQTITKDQFEVLGNYTNINYLNLSGTKVTDASGNDLSISEATTLANNTLKKLTKMKALNLNDVKYINNINFVSSLPDLYELMLIGCDNVSDLSILETQTNAQKLNLDTLAINNASINLTTIQNTLNGLGGYCYYCHGSGIFISNASLYMQLGSCTNLTQITIDGSYQAWEANSDSCTVNLTNCTKITSMHISHAANCSWVLPNSVKSLLVRYDYANFDCSGATSLESVTFGDYGGDSMYTSIINSLGNSSNSSLKSMDWINTGWSGPEGNMKFLEPLKNCPSLETISFTGWFRGYGFTSLEGLEKLTQIKYFKAFRFFNLTSISDLSKLTNLETLIITESGLTNVGAAAKLDQLTNLTSLTLNYCNITEISGLFNCTQIQTLNLAGNCLYDTASYVNSSGEQINYTILEKLAYLNTNGNLRYLYIAGNSNITDFSPVSNLAWTDKSGF